MSPAPVNSGTGLFIGAICVVIIWFWALERAGYVTKDSFQIVSVVATVGGIGMWLLWLCAWMHQWHPLITPTWVGSDGLNAGFFTMVLFMPAPRLPSMSRPNARDMTLLQM